MKKKDGKNPNILHYAGFILVMLGWWQVLRLNLLGFGAVLLGGGIALLSREYEDVREK